MKISEVILQHLSTYDMVSRHCSLMLLFTQIPILHVYFDLKMRMSNMGIIMLFLILLGVSVLEFVSKYQLLKQEVVSTCLFGLEHKTNLESLSWKKNPQGPSSDFL